MPAFRPPEAKNARQVLVLLGTVLIGLFVGITFLANGFSLTPTSAGNDQLTAGSPCVLAEAASSTISYRP